MEPNRSWEKEAEAREATIELLRLCNKASGLTELMRGLMRFFLALTGCEAVGARLRNEDDFPYYETRGFPEEFVLAENRLCAVDERGEIVRDNTGHPLYDCMCGNILCGRFDPSKPFFTGHGSFWSSCTTDLLASTTDADRQAKTRNRCNGEGYESVALVPIRSQGETFGLFQFNDKRKGRFTAERIALLEGLVDQVAIAIAKLRADEALRRSEKRYRSLFENMMEGFAYCRMLGEDGGPRDFEYLEVNDAFENLTGLKDVVGKKVTEVIPGIRETTPEIFEIYARVSSTGKPEKIEVYVYPLKRWFSVSAYSPARGFFIAVFDNITERRRLEEQLRQSQKMEAVGQLAGGVAHDFNNLLTVINGYAELLQNRIDEKSPLRGNVDEIRHAGDRAASLTRQLLAFSRRQVLQPKPIVLNGVISHLGTMLRRLIGENIELRTFLRPDLGTVLADRGQIEQVLLNLAVNARDAMSAGGKLILETDNVVLDDAFAREHPTVVPGPHVLLAVSDTGAGIPGEIREHIFEPFFSTKERGKGTGLGLSTVYGIVKQSNGYISVYSEVGKGTVFRIYLPRVEGEVQALPSSSPAASLRGDETVLVVEDERSVQGVIERVLSGNGYRVLLASEGSEALRVAGEHEGPIDLLVTDLVMPGMGGREVARRLEAARPGLRVLYMSGYTEDAISHHGVLDPGLAFLQKPFLSDALLRKVREVLHR
jgi:two-component system cell cycle sensor histidine kinase/response regulator CckA